MNSLFNQSCSVASRKLTKTKTYVLTALCALLVAFPCRSHGAVVTFNSASDIDAYFTTTGTSKFTSVASGGISNSGALAVDSAFTTGALVSQASLQGGASNPIFSASVYFCFSSPTSDSGGNMLTLGLTNSSTFDPSSNSAYDEIAIQKQAFSSQYFAEFLRSGGGFGFGISLQNGGWYRLTLNAVWDSTINSYDIQCLVNQSDSSGTVGTTLYSYTLQGSDDFNPSGPIYAFVAASGPAGAMGVEAIDNFAFTPIQVPEPSTFALLLSGIVLLGASRCLFRAFALRKPLLQK